MAILSKSSVYGLRAMLYIAAQSSDGYLSIRTMADDLDISFHFLTKILQNLTQKELLTSSRGAKGGVRLSRHPEEISLVNVLNATEGEDLFSSCILGLPDCGDACPCPLHETWSVQRSHMKAMFADTSLDQFQEGLRTSEFRINSSGHILLAGT